MGINTRNNYFRQEDIKEYLKDVKKHGTLITRSKEVELLHRIKNDPNDLNAIEQLTYANLRYVIFEAKKFIGCGIEIDDLISEGNYGLVKAAKRFDVDNNHNKFISYATYWIRQAIFQCITEHSRTIRIPSNVQNELNRIKNSKEYNDYQDINNYLGIPLVNRLNDVINESGQEFGATLSDSSYLAPDDYADIELDSMRYVMNQVMDCLDERENRIIRGYYGLDGVEYTLQEIAEDIGLTKERVRQIKDKALRKIRHNSRDFIEYLS